MTTLLAKVYTIPAIQTSRATCVGMQYIIADFEYLHVVTVDGNHIICSCGKSACAHIQLVQDQQARNVHANALRAAYCELFDLSYGD
jgi:hypothetical protein